MGRGRPRPFQGEVIEGAFRVMDDFERIDASRATAGMSRGAFRMGLVDATS